jgi:hypothetical protein
LKIKLTLITNVVVFLILGGSVGSTAVVIEQSHQKWSCYRDNQYHQRLIPAFPSANLVMKAVMLYAGPKGNQFEVVLVNGGNTGLYLAAHQNSIQHIDTDFHALILVRDQMGYSWVILPELRTHFIGAGKFACGAQFDIPEKTATRMLDAKKNGAQFAIVVAAAHSRKRLLRNLRSAFGEKFSTAAAQFLSGDITADGFLSNVNSGLSAIGH